AQICLVHQTNGWVSPVVPREHAVALEVTAGHVRGRRPTAGSELRPCGLRDRTVAIVERERDRRDSVRRKVQTIRVDDAKSTPRDQIQMRPEVIPSNRQMAAAVVDAVIPENEEARPRRTHPLERLRGSLHDGGGGAGELHQGSGRLQAARQSIWIPTRWCPANDGEPTR